MPKNTTAADQRIAELGQRFSKHAVGRRPQAAPRTRERHSLYLDSDLIAQASQAYRDLSHQLYPQSVNKSAFWEALISYGLAHLPEIRQALTDHTAGAED